MKRGISLIVLVITIIVMIILAAAIIISISNSNVINKANEAVNKTNIVAIKEAAALKFADVTLAIKEAGSESILGGKTVGEYIQQELINEGTMKETDAAIFTSSGAVYAPNETTSIQNKSSIIGDYRYIGNKLCYVGTDIEVRSALRSNADISLDYIYVYSNMDANNDHIYTLNEIGYLGKVKSFSEIMRDAYNTEEYSMGVNNSFTKTSLTSTDNIILTNGITLYSGENYTDKIGQVILFGDIYPLDGKLELGDDWSMMYYLVASEFDDGGESVSIAEAFNDEGTSLFNDSEIAKSEDIITAALDIDMNGILNRSDFQLYYDFLIATQYSGEQIYGKSISQMNCYINAPTNPTSSNIYTKSWYQEHFNINKVINRFPADIAK